MKKFMWFIIICIALAIILPMAYILVPAAKPLIGGTFGSIAPVISNTFSSLGTMISTMPYGLWIIVGIGFMVGIIMDRYAHSVYYGMRRRMVYTTYQDAGFTPQSNVGLGQGMVSTQSQPQSTVVAAPPAMQLDDEA